MSLRFLTVNQYSDLTGQDRRTIKKKLSHLDGKRQGKSILYDSREALPILYGVEKGNEKISNAKLLEEQQLRYERARAEKVELEVAQTRGDLVPIEEVAQVVEKEYSFVRSQVRSLHTKLAKPLSIITNPEEIQERLMEAEEEILRELSADKTYEQRRIELESVRAEANSGETEDSASVAETEPS